MPAMSGQATLSGIRTAARGDGRKSLARHGSGRTERSSSTARTAAPGISGRSSGSGWTGRPWTGGTPRGRQEHERPRPRSQTPCRAVRRTGDHPAGSRQTADGHGTPGRMADGRGDLRGTEGLPPHLRPVARHRHRPEVRTARRARAAAEPPQLDRGMGRVRGARRRVTDTSYDVRFWKIEIRPDRRSPYRVVWLVAGQRFSQSFRTRALADSFRAQLVTSASKGEAFDVGSGQPLSLLRRRTDVSFLDHAREYVASAWDDVADKRRVSILETLTRVLPVVSRDLPGGPEG